jgi:hypothetical protein
MTPTTERKVETLWTCAQILIQQIRELHASCETYRALLVNHNVFSQAEFEKTQVNSLAEFDRALGNALQLALDTASDDMLQQLSERTKGKPH